MKKLNRNISEVFEEKYPMNDFEYLLKKFIKKNLKIFIPADVNGNGWGEFDDLPFYGEDRCEMIKWLEKTCVGKWGLEDYGFYFEKPKDAIMFKLRWL